MIKTSKNDLLIYNYWGRRLKCKYMQHNFALFLNIKVYQRYLAHRQISYILFKSVKS